MATYVQIANTTLASTSNSITFSSISAAYTDLVLVYQMRGDNQAANVYLRFNGDSGANYAGGQFTSIQASGTAGAVTTSSTSIDTITWTGASANQKWAGGNVHINNYANTGIWKTTISRYGTAYGEATMGVSTWKNTAAISSIEISTLGGGGAVYSVGSTFTLYGILGA